MTLLSEPNLSANELEKAAILLMDDGYLCEYQALGAIALQSRQENLEKAMKPYGLDGQFLISAVFSQVDGNVYYMFDINRFDPAQAKDLTLSMIEREFQAGRFDE